jgi:hypothetical protein
MMIIEVLVSFIDYACVLELSMKWWSLRLGFEENVEFLVS